MSCVIEQRANAIGATFEPTRLCFDLSAEYKDVVDALSFETDQFLEAFASLKANIPLPRTATVSMDGHFYRLPGHNRSFCYSLARSDSFLDAPVIVVKGAEPLLQDFQTLIGWMSQAPLRRSSRVMTDHFPLAEGKIPGALSLKEAVHEAGIALEIQRNHLRYYGELARLPTPLLIHSFPEQKNEECAVLLRKTISQVAFERVEPLLNSGLAIYIYYYPAAPIRANYWGGMASPQVTQHIERSFGEEVAISGWVKLIARLLHLGYLPYSVRNDGLGACMDVGNATLDGGFCDPDSIVPIISGSDDEFLREGVIRSLAILQTTVQLLLGLSSQPDLYPSIDEFVCGLYIRGLLSNALKSEGRPGLHLDDRILQLLSPRSIADVKLCTARKNRIGWYAHFAKRSAGSYRSS